MDTITIELPETLSQAIHQRDISRQRLEDAVLNFLELYVRELDQQTTASSEHAWSDAADFARRIIRKNRDLFEALAKL